MSALPSEVQAPLPAAITAKMPVIEDGEYSILFDTARFEQAFRVARLFSASKFVPEAYQGSPENCFVALQMATRLRIDPMMFMQKTYIVHGKPGMEATLAIALINARGPFDGPIQWKLTGEGMDRACTAYAKHRHTGEICEVTVDMKMAKAEGWYDKSGSKWKTIPDQMLRYRSASFLGRLYAPECLMGISTVDELDDITPKGEIDVTPQVQTSRGASALLRQVATSNIDAQISEPSAEAPTQGVVTTTDTPAAQAQQQSAPADPAPQQRQQAPADGGAPTIDDAIALVKKGDYDMARDIAKGIGQLDVVDGMIAAHEDNAQPAGQQQPTQQAPAGRGRGR